ncbi:serine/arginine-rich splicing factor SR45a [Cucumis melo var. makuwa]|uniref:Serine/arginine-rich splicing factor SR45a n=1 Tax=Cucumis melo var. makuwa TaxID=1194695 RepID=A0A5A7SJ12_CUCMM|nr:serine/arginine-rich splicing factor SR45a [Cucumis melo var. makuwa]TYK12507.1 serine/arginine-rich splicing factor SR45a [Cucumis melo var. makuwa]
MGYLIFLRSPIRVLNWVESHVQELWSVELVPIVFIWKIELLMIELGIISGTLDLLPPGELLQDQDPDLDHDRGPGPGPDHGQGQDPQVVEDQGPEVVGASSRDHANNPGNTLYVTGLSTRVTERDLEDHFSKEGKVASCFLVVEPRTRISRGFAFVTMDNVDDANRCVKHLNQSVLEGRYITVEKSRRKRPRTPTPGHYLGLKSTRDSGYRGDRGSRYRGGGSFREDYGYRRSPRRSPYRGAREYSPRHSPPYGGGRSRRDHSRSPPPYSPPYGGSPDRRYPRGSR